MVFSRGFAQKLLINNLKGFAPAEFGTVSIATVPLNISIGLT